jgi:hypothetical protein
MKTKTPHLGRERKLHKMDWWVFILLAVLFGSALICLAILFFKMP